MFDQEPLKGNVKTSDVVDTSGVNFRMHSRIGEEFMVTVPITGEKAKVGRQSSSVKRRKHPLMTHPTLARGQHGARAFEGEIE